MHRQSPKCRLKRNPNSRPLSDGKVHNRLCIERAKGKPSATFANAARKPSPMNFMKVQACSLLNRPEYSKKSCNTVEVTRSPSWAIRREVPAISQNTTAKGCRKFDVSILQR